MKKILLFKKNSRLCCVLFLQLLFLPAYSAQQLPITGTVSDAQGPMPGVSITLKGSPSATITDLNGAYTITASRGEVVVYSFLGYQTQEVVVSDQTTIDVVLVPDANVIDEVTINAGYYTVKDKERTGSISRITAKDIEKQPVNNPLGALQGRMAGVDVVETSGVSGSGFEVKIRGVNSIMAGNSPLYIIDGVPFDSNSLGASTSSLTLVPGGNISPLNAINPANIESIEVLKDADATAIYGSRGANGVVLITTKKGKQGKTNYTISGMSGTAAITMKRELLNTEQYLAMRREAFANDGVTDYPANAYDVNGRWDENRFTDWQKVLLGGTAKTQQIQASVSGGSEYTQFMFGGMHQNETTVFPGDFNYNRLTFNPNVLHQSSDKKFKIGFSGGFTIEKNHQPGNDLTPIAIRLAPNAPELFDEEGNLNWEEGTWTNPLAQLKGQYNNNTKTLLSNVVVEYKVFKNFEVKLNAGYTYSVFKDHKTIPHTVYNPSFGMNSNSSQAYSHQGNRESYIIEPQLRWTKQWEHHRGDILIGSTFQRQKSDMLTLLGVGFAHNSFLGNLGAAKTLIILNENTQEYNYQSVFARLNYGYKDKLFVNLTGRRDGSSRFSPDNRYGNFGALGVGWLFSEDMDVAWLPFGKIRGSYGLTGNDQIGDYQYMQTYTISDFSYDGNVGLQPARLYNADFGWEKNVKKEIALELGLWEQRLSVLASYYNNRSSNQLINYALPGTTGFTSIQANLDAIVENSGWEFEVGAELLKNKDWSWKSAFQISLPKNKLVAFPGLEDTTYANKFVIGQPISIVKLYHLTGVNPETGVFEFEDFNGDGLITAPDDKQYIADFTPKYFGGWSNSVGYKKWSLDVFFQFMNKKGYNEFFGSSAVGGMINQSTAVLNRWQESGDQASMQLFTAGGNSAAATSYSRFTQSNGIISDLSFTRLKSIQLSYTLDYGKDKSNSCQVYLQGQNLMTFTKFKGGDPEQGIGYLPSLRRINLGVKLQF